MGLDVGCYDHLSSYLRLVTSRPRYQDIDNSPRPLRCGASMYNDGKHVFSSESDLQWLQYCKVVDRALFFVWLLLGSLSGT